MIEKEILKSEKVIWYLALLVTINKMIIEIKGGKYKLIKKVN